MNYIVLSIVLLSCFNLISCTSKQISRDKSAQVVFVPATTDDLRINQVFEKQSEVAYGKDRLVIRAILQIPEIEIPRLQRARKASGLDSALDSSSAGVHVFNGHVCTQTKIKSSNMAEYSKDEWQTDLKVNGVRATTEVSSRPSEFFDLGKGKVISLPEQIDITVCTLAKFPKVKNVVFTVKDANQKNIAEFKWFSPWPLISPNGD